MWLSSTVSEKHTRLNCNICYRVGHVVECRLYYVWMCAQRCTTDKSLLEHCSHKIWNAAQTHEHTSTHTACTNESRRDAKNRSQQKYQQLNGTLSFLFSAFFSLVLCSSSFPIMVYQTNIDSLATCGYAEIPSKNKAIPNPFSSFLLSLDSGLYRLHFHWFTVW